MLHGLGLGQSKEGFRSNFRWVFVLRNPAWSIVDFRQKQYNFDRDRSGPCPPESIELDLSS